MVRVFSQRTRSLRNFPSKRSNETVVRSSGYCTVIDAVELRISNARIAIVSGEGWTWRDRERQQESRSRDARIANVSSGNVIDECATSMNQCRISRAASDEHNACACSRGSRRAARDVVVRARIRVPGRASRIERKQSTDTRTKNHLFDVYFATWISLPFIIIIIFFSFQASFSNVVRP